MGTGAGDRQGPSPPAEQHTAFLTLSAQGLRSRLSKTFRLRAGLRNVSVSFGPSGVRPLPASLSAGL